MKNKLKSKMKTSKHNIGEKVTVEKAKERMDRRKERLKRYVFIDIETGGFNDVKINNQFGREYYPILQIAVVLTDKNYNEIAEPLNIIIKQNEEELSKCSDWSKEQFKDTLMKDCLKSEITLSEAENRILEFLKDNNIKEKESYLAGNSIRLDRDFITVKMPKLNGYLHYRMLDVTALKLFMNDVCSSDLEFKKVGTHDALSDIKESIKEIKYYKDLKFNK
tara:strand:+ start:4168 stop:4830 length:663 start_codon:yes stop_codon:yes gene_type:complete